MKRITAAVLCLCLLTIPLLATLPVGAEQEPWNTLYYVCDANRDGTSGESGKLMGLPGEGGSSEDSRKMLLNNATISCNPTVARLFVNGEPIEGGAHYIGTAGYYTVRVESTEIKNAAKTYYLQVLPNLGFPSKTVFVDPILIECTNASYIQIKSFAGADFDPAQPLTIPGEYNIHIRGREEDERGFDYTIYLYYCKAEQIYDETLGKNALRITTSSSIEGLEVFIDGALAQPGVNLVTGVKQHTVTATLNGAPVSGLLLPRQPELLLQVRMSFGVSKNQDGVFVSDQPFYFDLDKWDAAFYLDDKPISGEFRLVEDGDHVLTVRDAEGNEIPNALLVQGANEQKPVSLTSIQLRFENPHKTYAVLMLAPSVILLAVALVFLLKRRRVV